MKIGLFTDTYQPEINGVVTSVSMLREGLRTRGHEVWVIAPSHPDAPAAEDEAEECVLRVPSMPLIVLPERRFATPVEMRLMRAIRDLSFDVIHTNAEFMVNSFGFRAHKKYGMPLVHTYHTVWEEYTHYLVPGAFDRPARAAVRRLSVEICDRADRVIAPTGKTRDLLESYGVEVPIDVIPTGVDLARFSPTDTEDVAQSERQDGLRRQWGLERFSVVLLSIGRVASEKSILELLLLVAPWLKDHPEAGLLIVGGGPQLHELQRLVPTLGLEDQIVFTGEQPWGTVPDYYRIADMLVGNSHTETQGLTFIEAIASGVPIVVRDNPCFEGIIEDGVSGALLNSDDAFIPAIETLLGGELRKKRIAGGIAAAQNISKEAFAEAVEETYYKAIEKL